MMGDQQGEVLHMYLDVATETTASRNWGKLVARRSSTKGVDR